MMTIRYPDAASNIIRDCALFEHPDGMGSIQFDAEFSALFVMNKAEGDFAQVNIGPNGMRILAGNLLILADKLEGK